MRTLYLLGICLLAGCATTIDLPQEKIDQIPDGANRIDVYSDLSVNELSDSARQFMIEHDFQIREENEATRRVETESREVGQRTSLSIVYRTTPDDQGSKLEAIGIWSTDFEEFSVGTASQNVSSEDHDRFPAAWTGAGRGSSAFAYLVTLFDEFPSREVRYVKQ